MFFNTPPWWELVMWCFENKLFFKSSCDCSPGSTILGSCRTFWIWSLGDRLGPVECNFEVMTSLYDLELPAFSTPGIWTKCYNKILPLWSSPYHEAVCTLAEIKNCLKNTHVSQFDYQTIENGTRGNRNYPRYLMLGEEKGMHHSKRDLTQFQPLVRPS